MALIKENTDFDMIVEHHLPSVKEREKICRYIDKLKKLKKTDEKEQKRKKRSF
jgi:hypothetical protein